MPFYRFYLFMADGHIGEAQQAHCADDTGAIAKAAEFIGLYPALEIWHEGRKVARLSAEELASPHISHCVGASGPRIGESSFARRTFAEAEEFPNADRV